MIDPKTLPWRTVRNLSRPPRAINKLGYKGVVQCKKSGRYFVRVWMSAEFPNKNMGGFDTLIEAAKAYDAHMRTNVGDWVYCNFHKNGRRNKK